MEAQVQRVQHEAAARNPEVRLVMLMVVPAERRNAVAAFEPEIVQCDGELPRTPHRVAVRRAMEALVGKPRDDLAVAVIGLGAPQEVRQRQLEIHHQAVHHAVTGAPSTASATSARSSAGGEPRPWSQSARL